MSSTAPHLSLNPGQQRVVRSAAALLAQARGQVQGALMHRSLRRLHFDRAMLAEMAAVAVVLTTAVALARPWLVQAWDAVLMWWSPGC
jgi:hypothetical protein